MTHTILQVDSSILGDNSVSRSLVQQLTDTLAEQNNAKVITRDVAANPLPHLDGEVLGNIAKGEAKLADAIIEEAQQADIIVIGAPMYNFFIPSQLKTWFDYLARAKVTFEYTANGPKGLLTNKKVYVVTTRGGQHKDSKSDVLTPYLKIMLGFVGLNDVEFIYAEGLNMSGSIRETQIEAATSHIASIQHHPKNQVNNEQEEEETA